MKNITNKKIKILTITGILLVLIFLIYSTWLLSLPKPLEIQGEVDCTQIRVASKIAGRVDSIAVRKGDIVKQGQLLYIIKSPEIDAKLNQAQAMLKSAEAMKNKALNGAEKEDIQAVYNNYLKAKTGLELAEKTYKRIKNLFEEGVFPAQKKDEAEANYISAVETAEAAKQVWLKALKGSRAEDKDAAGAMVEKAEAAIKEIESFRNEMCIYAPTEGEVSDIISECGELVGSGFPVVTIAKTNESWITLNLREDLLSDIKMGSILSAKFPALKNKNIKLKVTYIHNLGNFAIWNSTKTSGDFDMKTFEVHAVPTENNIDLKPGMSALINWEQFKK